MAISVDETKIEPGSDREKTVVEMPLSLAAGQHVLIIDSVPAEGPVPLHQDDARR